MQILSRLSLSAHPDAFLLLDAWVDGRRIDVGLVRRWPVGGDVAGSSPAAAADVELQQQAARLLRARLDRRPPCRCLRRLVLGDVADPQDTENALHETLAQCGNDDALLIICARRDAYARAMRTLNLRAGSFMPGLDPGELPEPGHRWPRRSPRDAVQDEGLPRIGRRRGDQRQPVTG